MMATHLVHFLSRITISDSATHIRNPSASERAPMSRSDPSLETLDTFLDGHANTLLTE